MQPARKGGVHVRAHRRGARVVDEHVGLDGGERVGYRGVFGSAAGDARGKLEIGGCVDGAGERGAGPAGRPCDENSEHGR